MIDTTGLDRLRELHRRLGVLLNNPQPGLFTWRTTLSQRLMDMADYAGLGFVHTFPDVLDALKGAEEAARLAGIHQTPDGDECVWYARVKTVIANAAG